MKIKRTSLENRLRNDLHNMRYKSRELLNLIELFAALSYECQVELEQDVLALQARIAATSEDKARPRKISIPAAFEIAMKTRMWQARNEVQNETR